MPTHRDVPEEPLLTAEEIAWLAAQVADLTSLSVADWLWRNRERISNTMQHLLARNAALREALMNAIDVADQEATVAHASDLTWQEIEACRAVWKATD